MVTAVAAIEGLVASQAARPEPVSPLDAWCRPRVQGANPLLLFVLFVCWVFSFLFVRGVVCCGRLN